MQGSELVVTRALRFLRDCPPASRSRSRGHRLPAHHRFRSSDDAPGNPFLVRHRAPRIVCGDGTPARLHIHYGCTVRDRAKVFAACGLDARGRRGSAVRVRYLPWALSAVEWLGHADQPSSTIPRASGPCDEPVIQPANVRRHGGLRCGTLSGLCSASLLAASYNQRQRAIRAATILNAQTSRDCSDC